MALDRASLRQAVLEIAREIQGEALFARDGGIYWTQPLRPGQTEPAKPLDSFLYPGAMGIALFFAASGRVLEIEEHAELARRIVAPLRRDLREIGADPERRRRVRLPIGGMAGLGSLIYGLVRLGDLLADPGLWQEALSLSAFLTPERIAEDQDLDVMTGSAGALLALLALEARRPEANPAGHEPLALTQHAAEHLCARRASWAGDGIEPPAIGFCHGVSGIACALSQLAGRTGRSDLAAAAEEAWSYVASRFDPAIQGWRLPHDGSAAGNSWCNGGSGILFAGIARASGGPVALDGSSAAALAALRRPSLEVKDHLCCGNMGRVDLLLHAAERLGDPASGKAAESLAAAVLARAREEGRYRLMFHPEPARDIRLFPGVTGIGYALLRVAAPREVPCVLSLI